MNPVSDYAKNYIPEYYHKLHDYEKRSFIKLFDSPFNKYMNFIKKCPEFSEEKLFKACEKLKECQINFLDHLNLKYLYNDFSCF